MIDNALTRTAPAAHGTLRRLAQEFEAHAVSAMFQPVFAALPSNGPFGGGQAEAQWRPMLVDAIARDMSRAGGLGIGDAVYRALLRTQEGDALLRTQEGDALLRTQEGDTLLRTQEGEAT